MPDFEVAIYNKDVREKVAEGRRHRDLADSWAEIHYIEVEAHSAEEARRHIERKYPPHRGYVIDSIDVKKY